MKNKHCYLFIIKNLLDKRDTAKIERFFQNLLEPHDFSYLANITIDDTDTFVACFDLDKIKIMEKVLSENNVLIKSEDITEKVINLDFCQEVKMILADHRDNREIIERFIIHNLDLDKILDKICISGVESLHPIERKFLIKF
jgi:hypothetical protein